MATMKEQRNELVQMSREQLHPNESLAQDFEVMSPADAARLAVPGCRGNMTESQYAALLKESSDLRTVPFSGKSGLEKNPKRK